MPLHKTKTLHGPGCYLAAIRVRYANHCKWEKSTNFH